MKSQVLPVLVSYNGVIVVVLEDVEKLREDRKVTSLVLIFHEAFEGVKRKKTVEVICRAQVKRFVWLEVRDVSSKSLQRHSEWMRLRAFLRQLDEARINVGRQVLEGGTNNGSPAR